MESGEPSWEREGLCQDRGVGAQNISQTLNPPLGDESSEVQYVNLNHFQT